VIFPRECKEVGYASTKPCGDRTYFLSRYLIHETPAGYEILEVEPDPAGTGLMRDLIRTRVIATPGDVLRHPEKVNLYDRARLVRIASESGCRCTIFSGRDEHATFVLDPDLSSFLTVHVYDNFPPLPALSAAICEQEACGLYGELDIFFEHHVQDVGRRAADVFPCRAAGFSRTLDADRMHGGERVAGCLTGAQLYRECYDGEFTLEDICPVSSVMSEPFITRCCRSEREGTGIYQGRFGAIVHWGASPCTILRAVHGVVRGWREHADRGC
jgi:hypothetical protein